MNHYPLWKNLLVILIVLFGFVFAMPNLFGESPAVQVSQINSNTLAPGTLDRITAAIQKAGIPYGETTNDPGKAIVVFADTTTQLHADSVIKQALGDNYSVAMNLVPRTPQWMQDLGLKPMTKGLDLVGGIYFRLKVDLNSAINQMVESELQTLQTALRGASVRYTQAVHTNGSLNFTFADNAARLQGEQVIRKNDPTATFVNYEVKNQAVLHVTPSPARLQQVRDLAVEENVSALRQRVNELGVAEPIVQREGSDFVVVELPGLQNAARAKEQLGDTATVQFRLVYPGADPVQAQRSGQIPLDAQLYTDVENGGQQPILLKREIVAAGPEITDATSGFDQQSASPSVNVTLDSAGASRMGNVTRHNLGKPMAVLYIQNRTETKQVDGKPVQITKKVEQVINVATIRGVFSNQFQITGLSQQEAQSLALTLRTPLAAPVTIVEEQTIGPSLGQQNIRFGLMAIIIGFVLVVLGMAIYYKVFGLIADAAIVMNLILIVALLSLLQATLTLPGIAGIVLTIGMAVDANVLINERIREELRIGSSPQAAIQAGYARAMTAIVDSNVATLIAGLVLFAIGTGPVKGFAITLSLGIVTSMFTAIMGTRAIVNGVFGARRLKRLPV